MDGDRRKLSAEERQEAGRTGLPGRPSLGPLQTTPNNGIAGVDVCFLDAISAALQWLTDLLVTTARYEAPVAPGGSQDL